MTTQTQLDLLENEEIKASTQLDISPDDYDLYTIMADPSQYVMTYSEWEAEQITLRSGV